MVDNEGKTPLIYAAIGNAPGACEQLSKQLKKTDNNGKGALDYALEYDSGEAFATLCGASKTHTLCEAAFKNKFKICKAIADVARTGQFSGKINHELKQKQITACKKQLSTVSKNYQGVPDGLDPLLTAIHAGAWEAVRVLAPVYSGRKFLNIYSPLMVFVRNGFSGQPGPEYERFLAAGKALIHECSGQVTPQAGEYQRGATALMLGVLNYQQAKTEPLLKLLIPLEGNIIDAEGSDYLKYAESAGVCNEV